SVRRLLRLRPPLRLRRDPRRPPQRVAVPLAAAQTLGAVGLRRGAEPGSWRRGVPVVACGQQVMTAPLPGVYHTERLARGEELADVMTTRATLGVIEHPASPGFPRLREYRLLNARASK